MPQDHIRYDILAQEALRGVIRKVLSEVAATGHLPGDHHFFITFLTDAPGVRISPQLKARYDEQMTIVVQHQFWDMKVEDTYFEIGLSFSDVPEKLVVPFSAVRGFYDPSVNFELEFDPAASDEAASGEIVAAPSPNATGAGETDGDAPDVDDDGDEAPRERADVVSLDAFRKKN